MKQRWLSVFLIITFLAALNIQPAQADPSPMQTLIPIGSDYRSDTLQQFARAAAQRDVDGVVNLLVLPIAYGTDAFNTSNGERQQNLTLADNRRSQVEVACNAVKLPSQTCRVVLALVLVRSDAYLQSNLDLFVPDLDGMFILGGDQTIAMQVVAGTPFETKMAAAFDFGAVVSGNSAGAAVQSLNMIGGFTGGNGPENGFQQGAVDLWLPGGAEFWRRGLSFGISNAIFEQHTFQRGRIARLVNAAFTTGLLGIGMDAGTGAIVSDEASLGGVTGVSAGIVVDLQTYSATGQFAGPTSSLSLRGAATHLVPPGNFGYDLAHRRPLVGGKPLPAPSPAGRSFAALQLPPGYGALLLAGDLSSQRSGSAVQRFAALSGGGGARLVVLALGYAKNSAAQADAKAYAAALQGFTPNPVSWFVVDAKADQAAVLAAIASATGVLLTAPDQALVLPAFAAVPAIASALRSAWAGGTVVLADNAAAAALGETASVDPRPSSASLEDDSMEDFLYSGVTVQTGLGWIPGIAVEPRMVAERHWGRLYNQIYRNPNLLGLGIDAGTAVELGAGGAVVWGQNTLVVLDGRYGSYDLGTNGALSARWVLMDTYVEGQAVRP